MFEGDSSVSVSSDSAISESDVPSPNASNTIAQPTDQEQVPLIVISDNDMHDVQHLILEEENSSSEVIASSKENISGSAELNTESSMTNAGNHNMVTVSDDCTLGNESKTEMQTHSSAKDKDVSQYNDAVNASVRCMDERVVSEDSRVANICEGEEHLEFGSRVLSKPARSSSHEKSDLLASLNITLSSTANDPNTIPAISNQVFSEPPPSEERTSHEQSSSREQEQGGEEREASNEVLACHTVESSDAADCRSRVVPSDAQSSCKPSNSSTVDPTQSEEVVAAPLQGKGNLGSTPFELFGPRRKQLQVPGDLSLHYTCYALDTPNVSSHYRPNAFSEHTRQTLSSTSLASTSTETINSEGSNRMEERSTILKCITDNSFLEFLIIEGLELDSSTQKGVVDVVLAQYSNELSNVENSIPKLAAQIRQTESMIGEQKDKVQQLQNELEFLNGEIIKNERLLLNFKNEQEGFSKTRKVLKRKVTRCEETMKKLLGNAKKSRCD